MISHELIAIDIPHMIHNINTWGKDEINSQQLHFSIAVWSISLKKKSKKKEKKKKLKAQTSTRKYHMERAFGKELLRGADKTMCDYMGQGNKIHVYQYW